MLKPTIAKVLIFLTLAAIVFLPLFLVGDGPAVFLPVAAIFWLDGLVHQWRSRAAVMCHRDLAAIQTGSIQIEKKGLM
jgi:hypothetical protein